MRNFTDPANPLVVKTLRYNDRWTHQPEVIFEREGLCSHAGCKCIDGDLACNSFDYTYFEILIYAWYAPLCYSHCGCRAAVPPFSTFVLAPIVATGATNVSIDGLNNSTRSAENQQGLVGSANGIGGCLAGLAAGWTVRQLARCCVGFSFHELTPTEAYNTYGLMPYMSNADDSSIAVGACLESNLASSLSIS